MAVNLSDKGKHALIKYIALKLNQCYRNLNHRYDRRFTQYFTYNLQNRYIAVYLNVFHLLLRELYSYCMFTNTKCGCYNLKNSFKKSNWAVTFHKFTLSLSSCFEYFI